MAPLPLPLPRRRRAGRHDGGGGRPADDLAPVELETKTTAPGAIRQILRTLGVGLSVGILLLVIGLAGVLLVVPKVTGSVPLTILTQSMEPTLPPGTLIVVRPVDTDTLQIGDVATYQIRSGDPAVITHRILAIASESDGTRTFTFKGDNNAEPDSKPVTAAQIQGEVWYSVPLVGWANQAANGQARSWIIPSIAVALLAYAVVTIVHGAIQTRRRRRESAAEDVAADADRVHADAVSADVADAARADPTHPGIGAASSRARRGGGRGRHSA
ncbi:signal peptidase I [Clavibacter michiganensis]|uniref:Signal peptidase I n=3 Tax=Clavibacter michiganensis TaxID=28447 RepID=A0A0D5CG30_9MICO|nr:signal peptidase I [Clavibacter michiganensis]AJW78601.1 signal peptidase [Clavibacter michiganensis subsp. insidiosus]AWF98749.1 S26 family signal peptidase [Clavibacter michiganensis subsp. insidiosus]AWG01033.1 S26 family signal peptidase [Clavibacter michiganensis subsp. insidiosus]OQJ60397.1 S26 family signal peptidase [Clavibacter michiganensis subsp. insidiosus]RII87443.1 signal peptidase I [Clavibacter michiganensis subsp. insidiosus]